MKGRIKSRLLSTNDASKRRPACAAVILGLLGLLPAAWMRAAEVDQNSDLPGLSPIRLAQAGSAAATPAEPAGSALQEIVVTAQKREQRESDVGITITAATGQQLLSSGVTDVSDLPNIVPGLTTGYAFTGYAIFSIRGVNFNAANLATPPAVSVYMDQAALPYATQTGGLLFDVDRIEVLKGPQGTLFGQNSTGGSVNVIANKPTAELSAGVRTEVNNFGQTMEEGFVSGPLSDTLRARFAATITDGGAWQHGYYLNTQTNGDQNKGAARLLLDWTPNDRLKISANIGGNVDRSEQQQMQVALVQPSTPANAPPGLVGYPLPTNDRESDYDLGFDTHRRDRQYQAALRGDFEVNDALTISSITDYVNTLKRDPFDFDGTAINEISGFAGGTIKSFVQELRLTGKIKDPDLVYVLGANYQHDLIFDRDYEFFDGFSGLPAGTLLDARYNLTNRAAGVFGNLDYTVVPMLTITTGARFTKTRQSVDGCLYGNQVTADTFGFLASLSRPGVEGAYVNGGCQTINNAGPDPNYLPIVSNLDQNQQNVSWRFGLNFKPTPDDLIYALASRGFKAGTFPLSSILVESQMRNLSQEKLTSFEIGTKLALIERVRLDVSAFYYDYLDKQFYTYVPVPPIGESSTLVNIPKSWVRGVDADILIQPLEKLTVRGGVTYIKTEIGQFSGFTALGQPVSFGGKEFNFAPPVTATFDAEYRVPISAALQSYYGVGGLYNDRTFSDLGESPQTKINSRALLNVRLGLIAQKGWQVEAWVRNLTDKYYWNNVGDGGDTLTKFAGMPRTAGVSASYSF